MSRHEVAWRNLLWACSLASCKTLRADFVSLASGFCFACLACSALAAMFESICLSSGCSQISSRIRTSGSAPRASAIFLPVWSGWSIDIAM